jgi:hypothetical protein
MPPRWIEGDASRQSRDGTVCWWMIASGMLLTAVIALGIAIMVSNLRDRALAPP